MSIIAEVRMRSGDLVLAETLDAVPDVTLEVVTITATEDRKLSAFVWIHGEDFEAFEAAMSADPTVSEWETYNELEAMRLYHVQVDTEAGVVAQSILIEVGAHVLETSWREGWWRIRLRAPDHDAITRVREWAEDTGIDLELDGIFADRGPAGRESVLTPEQREVLTTAYDMGYFEIPRRNTLADVAAELDVSSQALSERLRRGYRGLVAEHVR